VISTGALCLFITRHGKRCFYPPLRTCEPAGGRAQHAAVACASREKKEFVYGLTGRQAAVAVATGDLVADEESRQRGLRYRNPKTLSNLPRRKYDGKRPTSATFVRATTFAYAEDRIPSALPEVVDFQRGLVSPVGRSDLPGLAAEDQGRSSPSSLRHHQDLPVTGATIRSDGRIEALPSARSSTGHGPGHRGKRPIPKSAACTKP